MNYINEISALVSAVIIYLLGWFFGGKRKSTAESISIEISNLRAVVDEYKELFEQMKTDLKEAKGEYKEAKDEYKEHLKTCQIK